MNRSDSNMKSKLRKLAILALGICILSCSKENNSEAVTEVNRLISQSTKVSVKSIVEKNEFINVDLTLLTPDKITAKKNIAERKIHDLEIAKAKAAVYRFYSNVKLVNGLYECRLKSGKDINISDNFFLVLSDNLKNMNSFISERKAKGVSVETPEISSEYLESLVRN